jgi:hypothetical protein
MLTIMGRWFRFERNIGGSETWAMLLPTGLVLRVQSWSEGEGAPVAESMTFAPMLQDEAIAFMRSRCAGFGSVEQGRYP